jgi:predicted small lipoprotein YifL
MRTKRLRYLQQKLHQELPFKSILLIFIAVTFLSACGIKGDLYETPEQPAAEQNKVTERGEVSQESGLSNAVELMKKSEDILDDSEKQQATQQPITPSDKQSTAPIKE